MKTVYRIEIPFPSHGMWYDDKGNYRPTIQILCPHSISKDFPMPYSEKHRKDGKVWYSAGKSKENMHHWFSKDDVERLVNDGFKLYEIEVTEYQELEYEILFTRESIVSQKEIPINEVWK